MFKKMFVTALALFSVTANATSATESDCLQASKLYEEAYAKQLPLKIDPVTHMLGAYIVWDPSEEVCNMKYEYFVNIEDTISMTALLYKLDPVDTDEYFHSKEGMEAYYEEVNIVAESILQDEKIKLLVGIPNVRLTIKYYFSDEEFGSVGIEVISPK